MIVNGFFFFIFYFLPQAVKLWDNPKFLGYQSSGNEPCLFCCWIPLVLLNRDLLLRTSLSSILSFRKVCSFLILLITVAESCFRTLFLFPICYGYVRNDKYLNDCSRIFCLNVCINMPDKKFDQLSFVLAVPKKRPSQSSRDTLF